MCFIGYRCGKQILPRNQRKVIVISGFSGYDAFEEVVLLSQRCQLPARNSGMVQRGLFSGSGALGDTCPQRKQGREKPLPALRAGVNRF
jgi:hypothetical protein